jgi:serine/threonine protein kinase
MVAPDGRPSVPKPGPPPAAQRWFQERPSEYPHEQDGLDHVRRLMPKAEPYRAWATFSFTAVSGRVNECDLLIAVPGGLHLIELKGHPGHAKNSGDTWLFRQPGVKRKLTLRNPLHLTDQKSKELKGRLDWAARELHISQRIPRVEPSIFLSAPGLVAELDEVQRARVYGRDDDCQGLPWLWRDLLDRPPQREHQRISEEFSRHVLPKLLDKIGIRASTAHLRFADDWQLAPEPMDVGRTWEDRLAQRTGLVREEGRVRIYLTAHQATEEVKQSVERAALREYQVLQGINHRGIAQAVEIKQHQGGPAILFRHRASDLRLDSYLAVHGDRLSPEHRLDLVRQLAEALRYAHSRSLYHRALAARSVYVSARDDGSRPVLRVIDWQAAARDFDTTGMSSIANSTLSGQNLNDTADAYLAPEFDHAYPDPVDLDVFGLGAVSYLIVTGQPPATQRSNLIDRLNADGGLHPYAVADGVSAVLDEMIFNATRKEVDSRLASAEAFLNALNLVERDSPTPEPAAPEVDPLTAVVGNVVDGWVVRQVLGTGATARTLLVERTHENDDGEQEIVQRVFKVALDEEKAARLYDEAKALEQVGGGAIVRLLDGPRTLAGHTVLDLEYAGEQSLGARLRAEGRLSYHDLERFGSNLFTALDQLAGKGRRHRDIKPDNFGVLTRKDRSRQLILFDFSLAAASDRDIKAGTRSYIDPLLGTERRRNFDDHAERYAAAITLHEMASGERPIWGDGLTDPRMTEDQTPVIAVELFEPALRDGLTEFFRRALHRDVDHRFDTVRQMEDAWRAVFTAADAVAPVSTPATVGLDAEDLDEIRDAHAAAAELSTPLEAAGLSPRAVSVARSFGATTVGELLNVRLHEIAKARGAGAVIRKELNRRHKQWTATLLHQRAEPDAPPAVAGDPVDAHNGVLTIDDLAALITPVPGRKGSNKSAVIRAILALPDSDISAEPWSPQVKVADLLRVTQATVSRHQQAAAKEWAAAQWLAPVRDELVEIVTEAGRVMTVPELAAVLRARCGAGANTPEHNVRLALAVVRAAVEAEHWAGMNVTGEDADGPRLIVLRRNDHVLVALESLRGTDDPSGQEMADYAGALGERADALAGQDPLPGRGVVVRELRAVAPPEGLDPLADTRLVTLAAATSKRAAASPRLELYPRDLDLVKALRIAQAAAGVRRDHGISLDELLARVRSRFPDMVVDERLTHVHLEDALKSAGFPLEYDPVDRRFKPPTPEPSRLASSSSTTLSGRGTHAATGLDPLDVLHLKLGRAVERGGFVALTLRGRNLPDAAKAIASAYPVLPVDVGRVFLTELRALAQERGQEWPRLLNIEARFTETGQMAQGFASWIRAVWGRVEERLLERAADDRTVLFLHDAGLVGRYHAQGGHDLLTRLQQVAGLPDQVPYGLWLLCPAESELDTAQLDGHTVDVTDLSQRVALSGAFLAKLRAESGRVA